MNKGTKRKIKAILYVLITVLAVSFAGCVEKPQSNSGNTAENTKKEDTAKDKSASKESSDANTAADTKNPIVTIEMEDGAVIKVELYPKTAPNTVTNFISLVNSGFYNGLIFHRVIPNFMIQGGDPQGTGIGGPGYTIKGEFSANGFQNSLKHERGVISMARTDKPDTAGSQFFIMVKDTPQLDGLYAAFGKVTQGMEEVDKIVSVKRDATDKPLKDQKMKKVTVDTFGVDYGQVKKMGNK